MLYIALVRFGYWLIGYTPPPPPPPPPGTSSPDKAPPPLSQLMLMLATYVNTLEADRNKLRQQVKRLCSENNWLRSELTDHQQLLQDTEVQLAKTKEEKEHLQFLLSLKVLLANF